MGTLHMQKDKTIPINETNMPHTCRCIILLTNHVLIIIKKKKKTLILVQIIYKGLCCNKCKDEIFPW